MSSKIDIFARETKELISRSNKNLEKFLVRSSVNNTPFINRVKYAIINDEEVICHTVDDGKIYTMGNCIVGEERGKDNSFVPYSILIFVSSEEESNDIKYSLWKIKLSTKKLELIDLFIQKYKVHPDEIHSYGDISIINNDFLKRIIPHKIINPTSESDVNAKEEVYIYKCYSTNETLAEQERKRLNNIIKHTSVTSSWNCLMEKLGNPKYAIIIKKYK